MHPALPSLLVTVSLIVGAFFAFGFGAAAFCLLTAMLAWVTGCLHERYADGDPLARRARR